MTNKTFKITWVIELYAKDELEASQLALKIQQDPNSLAKTFVVEEIGFGNKTTVDLTDE